MNKIKVVFIVISLFLLFFLTACKEVTPTVILSSSKEIVSFHFLQTENPSLNADISGVIEGPNIIFSALPFGTDIDALSPVITHNGVSIDPPSGSLCDFTNPVFYTVTAADGSSIEYTATIDVLPSTSKEFISFSFSSSLNVNLNMDFRTDISGNDISVTVPYGTDISSLIASFTTTGERVLIGSVEQYSGITPNDFTSPLCYSIIAADGSTNEYNVSIYVSLNSAKGITGFSILAADNPSLNADISGVIEGQNIIFSALPFGTDIDALSPVITHNGVSIDPPSGSLCDFTNPVIYTVTAADGSFIEYTASIDVLPSTSKEFISFSFSSSLNVNLNMDFQTDINGNDISVTVPYGTDISSLVASFTTTGERVLIGSIEQYSGITPNDFTSPLCYSIIAADGSTNEYNVSIYVSLNSAKEITSFSLLAADNSALNTDINGTFKDNQIRLNVPFGTERTNLIPRFTTSGETVHIGSELQISGTEPKDFTEIMNYIVSAEDGTTRVYEVLVCMTVTREQLDDMISRDEDVRYLDVSGITDMSLLFQGYTDFNQDIGYWDVSAVTDMTGMFYLASTFNQDIGDWDVNAVTNMKGMFAGGNQSVFNQDIGNWDVQNVTDMSYLFYQAPSFNQDIGDWNVGNVTDMTRMFHEASSFNQNIGVWDVRNVSNMDSMFFHAFLFNQDIGDWNVSNVTNMRFLFSSAYDFNQDLGDWNVGNVTDMEFMFYSSSFNHDIGEWDVSNVERMGNMFCNTDFNQNISGWNVRKVVLMGSMFFDNGSFNQDISQWDVSSVNSMGGMFNNAGSFNQDLSSWAEHLEESIYHTSFSGGDCPLITANHPFSSWDE